MIKEEALFLQTLKRKNSSRPPLWLMRQAGRYLPAYRSLRERYSFLEMCHKPELIAEVTQLPFKTFSYDAAILFSDILIPIEPLNRGLRFEEGRGPIIDRPIRTIADIAELPRPQIADALTFIPKGIRLAKEGLSVPLIGFCGAPFTVASYLIEGGSSKDLKITKQWMFRNPETFHQLLDKITALTIDYLQLQVAAGVDAIQIFDSWAQVLAHEQFRTFSLAYLQRLIEAIPSIPVILFCRGSSTFAPDLASIKPAAISVDWQGSLPEIRRRVGSEIALQGNLDPDLLYGDSAVIKRDVSKMLQSMSADKGYICNLGHGIHPDTPLDAVRLLIDLVHAS